MMNKYIITVFCLFLMLGCIGMNTTNPKLSKSVEDAKKRNVLVSEYKVLKIDSDTSLYVDEAWVEKLTFMNNDLSTEVTHYYMVCFKLVQTIGLFYSKDNYLDWVIKDSLSKKYVGLRGDIYFFSIDSNKLRDSITLFLFSDINDERVKKGSITFVRKGDLDSASQIQLYDEK